MILFILSLLLISALSKAVCDTLQFRYSRSIFVNLPDRWWNPAISWRNKHEWSDRYLIRLSLRTWLVTITDAWHLFQFLCYKSLHLAIALLLTMVDTELGLFHAHWGVWWAIISVAHQSLFHFFWSWFSH